MMSPLLLQPAPSHMGVTAVSREPALLRCSAHMGRGGTHGGHLEFLGSVLSPTSGSLHQWGKGNEASQAPKCLDSWKCPQLALGTEGQAFGLCSLLSGRGPETLHALLGSLAFSSLSWMVSSLLAVPLSHDGVC